MASVYNSNAHLGGTNNQKASLALTSQIEVNLIQTLFQSLAQSAAKYKPPSSGSSAPTNPNATTNSNTTSADQVVDHFAKQYEIFRVFQINAIRSVSIFNFER
jgi:hypothetical protein